MIKSGLRRLAVIVLILLLLSVGLGTGVLLDRAVLVAQAQSGLPAAVTPAVPSPAAATPAPGTPAAGSAPDFQLITEAWNTIDRVFVDRAALQSKVLTYGAISGMVSALGDTGHSTFLNPQMVKSERDYSRGQFEGIGAEVEYKDGHVVIVAPMDSSPAQKAGLHAGDAILKVNGDDVSGLPLEQVVGRILGPAGTTVTLTLQDGKTGQKRDVTLERARIVLHNVTWQRLPGTNTAHLRLAGFSQGVSRELRQALADMQQQGVTSVILDLRNNPGGLLNEAVSVTSQFLPGGDVLLEKDANGQVTHVSVRPGGVATGMPMVVLINNGSASAAEITAGAIQDAHRATLLGETTFGTGTVLSEFPLSDGSAMMLAIQEWLTPNGRVIWHKGIAPDQTLTLPAGAMALTPEGERSLTAQQLQASDDQQLLAALKLLNQSAQQTGTGSIRTGAASFDDVPEITPAPLALELDLLAHRAWF